ncbi:PQQ-binding-like beta-propeller repeat protein [Streptomyces sp. NPDC057027]|uniref:outer membrane protein assembly factor BamB family protein n=1 Tax=Streptomyces sp. NPDC057027 TaxID=3346004 RepID=UPI003634DBA2
MTNRDGTRPNPIKQVFHGVIALAVVLGVVLGIPFVFLMDSGYLPWFSMTTAWEAPHDRVASTQGNGAWLAGDTVARSRFDGVTGYDVRSGEKRWEYVPPRRADVCATTARADGPLVLIGYGEKDGPCATLAALDLTDGRERWHTTTKTGYGSATVGGGLVVLGDGGARGGLRALDLRTGAPRWTAAVPEGCTPGDVGTARKQVVALLRCGEETKLAGLDPADGRVRWTVPLDARRGVAADATASVLSADPAVVSVAEEKSGDGMRATLAFGPDGRPQGRIDDVGDYGSVEEVEVEGDRLFAIASYEGSQSTWERLVAFDLATGDQLWRTDLGNADLDEIDVTDGRVTTLDFDRKYGDSLHVFDAATGDEEDDRAFRDHVVGHADEVGDMFTYEDGVIAVRWGGGERPLSAYERW